MKTDIFIENDIYTRIIILCCIRISCNFAIRTTKRNERICAYKKYQKKFNMPITYACDFRQLCKILPAFYGAFYENKTDTMTPANPLFIRTWVALPNLLIRKPRFPTPLDDLKNVRAFPINVAVYTSKLSLAIYGVVICAY